MSTARLDLAERVRRADGEEPFNETSRMAMADGTPARVDIQVTDGEQVIALAFATADEPVEIAVDPSHRRRGHGTALLSRLSADGESRFWAHGDLPAAQAFASAHGLVPIRTLLTLGLGATEHLHADAVPDTTIRPFRDADRASVLAVNAEAFADHPEQGALDDDGFERLTRADWFDPTGLFVAERDGGIIGFHWTKREGADGEIYVLGVSPSAQAHGLGRVLAVHGLHHLRARGVAHVKLYVESDNASALRLYDSLGFTERGRDVVYASA